MPKIRGTFFGVAVMRMIIYWVLYWSPPILGNYHAFAASSAVDASASSARRRRSCHVQALLKGGDNAP